MLAFQLFFGLVAQLGPALIEALKALLALIPPAVWGSFAVAPFFALILNLAKKLPFWKDGWAGWASLVLNFLFVFFGLVARQYGIETEAGNLLEMIYNFLEQAIPVFWGLMAALGLTKAAHEIYKKLGMAIKAQAEKVEEEIEAFLRDVGNPGSDSPDPSVPRIIPGG